MAFIRINQIKDADGSIEPDELELANDIIEAMMITRKGSIPGSRGYGLTQIFIDMPGPDAINMITVELISPSAKCSFDLQVYRKKHQR